MLGVQLLWQASLVFVRFVDNVSALGSHRCNQQSRIDHIPTSFQNTRRTIVKSHTTRPCDCNWPSIALQTPDNNQAPVKSVLEFGAGLKRRALETLREPSQLLRPAKQRQSKTKCGVVAVGLQADRTVRSSTLADNRDLQH